MQLTVQTILAMQPGEELDRAVHSQAMARPGPAPAYSTKPEVAMKLIVQLPIGVAQLSPKVAGFKPEKPFVAFTLDRGQPGTFVTQISVTAATAPLALCKLALLSTLPPVARAGVPANHFPKLGSALQPRQLEPMPQRKPPEPPKIPGAPA